MQSGNKQEESRVCPNALFSTQPIFKRIHFSYLA
jgi:hypothetical protein